MQQKNNIRVMQTISLLQGMVFYASVATLYRQTAGLSVFQIALIESLSLALSLLLEIPWGVLADRIGYRKTMICCSFLFFLSKIIFWQAQGFGGFLAERLLLAVTLSGLSGVDESILYASCREEEVQKVFGRTQALGTAGLVFASIVCALFVGDHYRLAGLFTMIAYGLAALCSLFLVETKPPQRVRQSPLAGFRESLELVFHSRRLFSLILCGALFGEVTHTITVFLNQLQYTRCGWSSTLISAAYILATLSEMSSTCSAPLTQRLGERRTGMMLLCASAVCCMVLSCASNGWISLLCLLGMSLAAALFTPLSSTMENRLITINDRATALSVSSLLQDSIALLLNLLLGRAADHSLPLAMALGGSLCLLSMVMFSCSSSKSKTSC